MHMGSMLRVRTRCRGWFRAAQSPRRTMTPTPTTEPAPAQRSQEQPHAGRNVSAGGGCTHWPLAAPNGTCCAVADTLLHKLLPEKEPKRHCRRAPLSRQSQMEHVGSRRSIQQIKGFISTRKPRQLALGCPPHRGAIQYSWWLWGLACHSVILPCTTSGHAL